MLSSATSTTSRPRTKPRQEPGQGATAERTPDEVYIKVYPARLRALIAECGLTRTEIGALLMLALRIDQDATCFPSHARVTLDVQYRNRGWTRAQLEKLALKGALTIERNPDQSHTYLLPECFSFDVSKTNQGGDRISNHPPVGKPYTKKNHVEDQPVRSKQPDLEKKLVQSGVKFREASLLANQYDSTIIESVIEAAANNPALKNPGAWITTTIQKRSSKPIAYPNSRMDTQNAQTAAASNSVSPGSARPPNALDTRPKRPW